MNELFQEAIELEDFFSEQLFTENINLYQYIKASNVNFSTALEGSTLTQEQTFDVLYNPEFKVDAEVVHILENKDLYNALIYTEQEAKKQTELSQINIQTIADLICKNTKGIHQSALGQFDISKGEYRNVNVYRGRGGKSYLKHQLVGKEMNLFEQEFSQLQQTSFQNQFEEACLAHFKLLTIHPFGDGNGRTARLIQNYIEFYYGLQPTLLMVKYKKEYLDTLFELQMQLDEHEQAIKNVTKIDIQKFSHILLKNRIEFYSNIKQEIHS